MLIDLHVHTHHSRGSTIQPRAALERARAAGLDGVVFTDLNTLDGLEEIRAAGREAGVLALVGVEVATDKGRYLCYFPDPARVPPPPQVFGSATPWPVREVLARVRELGGVVVAAHPYDKTVERPSGDLVFTLDGLAAIEGLCGTRRGPANDLAVEAADHMNLPCVGGSGAHASADEVGSAATLFRDPVASEADLCRQLAAGSAWCVAVGVTPPPPGARPERGDRGERRGDRGFDRGGGRGERGGRRGGPRRGPRRDR